MYVTMSNNSGQFVNYSDDFGNSWTYLGGSFSLNSSGTFVGFLGNLFYITNANAYLIDVVTKTSSAYGGLTGLRSGLPASVSDAEGLIAAAASTSGGYAKIGLFKPFTYNPATETVLPSISNLIAATGKSVPPWIKVL